MDFIKGEQRADIIITFVNKIYIEIIIIMRLYSI